MLRPGSSFAPLVGPTLPGGGDFTLRAFAGAVALSRRPLGYTLSGHSGVASLSPAGSMRLRAAIDPDEISSALASCERLLLPSGSKDTVGSRSITVTGLNPLALAGCGPILALPTLRP